MPDGDRAAIIRHVYRAFLQGVQIQEIYRQAKNMGLKHTGNSCITKILACHAYGGLIRVRAYKVYPEEIVEGAHEALVDRITWLAAQAKLKRKDRPVQILNDQMPLRGVLLCHCGRALTGAPSRGRHGAQYYYYKCSTSSKHNNISVKKAHAQLSEIWKYLSIPRPAIRMIQSQAELMLEQKMAASKKALAHSKAAMEKVEE